MMRVRRVVFQTTFGNANPRLLTVGLTGSYVAEYPPHASRVLSSRYGNHNSPPVKKNERKKATRLSRVHRNLSVEKTAEKARSSFVPNHIGRIGTVRVVWYFISRTV